MIIGHSMRVPGCLGLFWCELSCGVPAGKRQDSKSP